MYAEAKARKRRMEKYIRMLERELADAPEGSLTCQKTPRGYKYYRVLGSGKARKRKYIPKTERSLAVELACKRVASALLTDCQRELKALNAYLDAYGVTPAKTDSMLAKSEGVRALVSEYYEQWQSETQTESNYYPEGRKNEAPGGNRVRSKGEADIWWELDDQQLPAVYEKELWLGTTRVLPDFTIKNPVTGEEVIWEHFGMMDNSDYARSAYRKISLYIAHGYFPGWNLIVTFEDKEHPLSRRRILTEIQHYFGDWLAINGSSKK